MKKILAVLVLVAMASPSYATTFTDALNDTFTTAGGGILDIASVDVTNTQTDISFVFTLAGDVTAPNDWGKYMVMIDSTAGGQATGNGWARPIDWAPNAGGADYWIGSWADSGNGAELWGSAAPWSLIDATYTNANISIVKTQFTVGITAKLASMNLIANNNPVICFDAFTSGGGSTDGAVNSLGNPNQQIGDWGNNSSANPVCYTLTPEPGTLCLLGLGALAMIRRKR